MSKINVTANDVKAFLDDAGRAGDADAVRICEQALRGTTGMWARAVDLVLTGRANSEQNYDD